MDEQAESGGVLVRNAQERVVLRDGLVGELAERAALVLELIRRGSLACGAIPGEVGIILIDDRRISRIHRDYFGNAGPTDVITFPYGDYGEVLISVETARRQGGEYATSTEDELALYMVHGILHLCGHEDGSREGRARMEELQERLLGEGRGGG